MTPFRPTQARLRPDEALAFYRSGAGPILKKGGLASVGFWASLPGVVEGLARLECRDDLLALAPFVEELRGSEIVMSTGWGLPVATVAGIVCRWADRWDEAEAHFRLAVHQTDTTPFEFQRGQTREWYAGMLLARGGAGDRDRARTLLGEARGIYTTLGFHGLHSGVKSAD